MVNVIFKSLEPYADVIESVSDERSMGDGIWIYPVEWTRVAAGICSPGQLHEATIRELLPQIKDVAEEIRERQRKSAVICERCMKDRAGLDVNEDGICVDCYSANRKN